MFQKNGILFKKKYFDQHIKEYFIQLNYYNNYDKCIGDSQIKDDIGWSCSIKSVQMLLSYFFSKFQKKNEIIENIYNIDGKLSIYTFIEKCKSLKYKEKEGYYFGVYQVLTIYNLLCKEHNLLLNTDIVMTIDNIIDIDKLNFEKSTILFFSTRLGISKLDPFYKDMILKFFCCPYFEGFLGGVGKSCYYFMAKHTCIDNLLYLDPHFISEYKKDINLEKITAKNYLSTHIDNLNPSLTFCFHYKNYDEFIELKKFLEKFSIFNILHKNSISYTSKEKDDWILYE